MRRLLLGHDVLDLQLLDRTGAKIGRVDALMLVVEPGKPVRVKSILIGGPVRQERVGRWAVWLGGMLRRMLRSTKDGASEIPFSAVRRIADSIELDVDEAELESEHAERWLCDHVVRRIPGAEGDQK